jgi:hypothetical protein
MSFGAARGAAQVVTPYHARGIAVLFRVDPKYEAMTAGERGSVAGH